MAGIPILTNNFLFKIDGSVAASTTDFSIKNDKGVIQVDTIDNPDWSEFISNGRKNVTIDFNGLVIRKGTAPGGYSDFDTLLNSFYTSNASVGIVILPNVSTYYWSGAGFITSLSETYEADGVVKYTGSVQGTGGRTRLSS